jgi:hypothetical protein
METPQLAILMVIVVTMGLFAMIFGIVYLNKRERMAMIERGMDPRTNKPRPAPYQYLKWGLLLIGAGVGLFLSFILVNTCFAGYDEESKPAIFFSLIAIFGGLGLLVSFLIEKKTNIGQRISSPPAPVKGVQ